MDRNDLSFKFSEKYSKQIEIYENKIYDSSFAIGKTGAKWLKQASSEEIKSKIILCDKAIQAFNEFKKYCQEKGKGGNFYFEDMWEHCHNSKNPCFSYIDDVIELKQCLEKHLIKK